jgi:hypothetical protein
MASLISVPTEVFYYYAKYIDLLDYGALLFCCKDLHDRLHEDLVFKKCVFDHSPFNIQNPKSKSSVRRRFIEYNAKLAARNNDPDLLFFYFPTLECYSILQQLRPVSPHLEKKLGRSNLLQLIDSADADKLLSFIIEVHIVFLYLTNFFSDFPYFVGFRSACEDRFNEDANDSGFHIYDS